jgi:hypothetical protein
LALFLALGAAVSLEGLTWGGSLLLAFLLVGRGRRPVILAWPDPGPEVEGRAGSEEWRCFSHLIHACRQNDAGAAFQAHLFWLASLELDEEVSCAAVQRVFAPFEEWMELQEALTRPEGSWCGRRLQHRLEEQRRELAALFGAGGTI